MMTKVEITGRSFKMFLDAIDSNHSLAIDFSGLASIKGDLEQFNNKAVRIIIREDS